MAKKICTKCAKVKDLEEFGPDTRYTYKRKSWCNQCVSEYQREYTSSEKGKAARARAQRAYMQRLRDGEFVKKGNSRGNESE